ncbi:iron transporter [Methylocapsa acidiphila]|uniref:iron transporter n=1 Tax=Methylocapsa acidiphila TaxID=133552 RepID=UPI0004231E4F|nr:iron transporter [Methylocapsa acidiphila]
MRFGFALTCVALLGSSLGSGAFAKEYPIGKPQQKNGMEIGAVYLQPIEMDPPDVMRPAKDSDVHLESDIKAAKDNKNGFAQGDWIPYLSVNYELTKLDDNQIQKGAFMPMVANDGPHYGDNVKMFGPGKYRLRLTIAPPGADAHAHFGRHVDKETGVAPWFDAFSIDYDFVYAGAGKKGAY